MAWCVVHGHLDGAADLICVAMHGRGAAFTLLRGAGSIRGMIDGPRISSALRNVQGTQLIILPSLRNILHR